MSKNTDRNYDSSVVRERTRRYSNREDHDYIQGSWSVVFAAACVETSLRSSARPGNNTMLAVKDHTSHKAEMTGMLTWRLGICVILVRTGWDASNMLNTG